jgi:hypothetical protein
LSASKRIFSSLDLSGARTRVKMENDPINIDELSFPEETVLDEIMARATLLWK